MDITPALLEINKADFLINLKRLSKYYTHFQIDVVDGELYPLKTIQIEEIEEEIKKLDKETLSKLSFDFDLMVKDYMLYIEAIEELEELVKVQTIFVRANLIENYQKLASLYPEIQVGLVIDPGDSIETITNNFDLEKVPVIQIMTVEPGAQGHSFQEDMLNKIEQLRMSDYRNKIYIDGGINEDSLKNILSKKYLPDALGIGSYLAKAGEDLEERVAKLKKL